MKIKYIGKQIDENRAAALLGFTGPQFRLLCEQSGLGNAGTSDSPEPRLFTYYELHRLCRWAARLAA
jgi:hypothetical protein